jgi:hypothetical protein
MPDRRWVLGKLVDNWPNRFTPARLAFIGRELEGFASDDLLAGVTHVLRTCQYPPTVAELHGACSQAKRRRESRAEPRKAKLMPGDIVNGEQTLTVDECKAELERMRKDHPEAFRLRGVRSRGRDMGDHERKANLEMLCHKLYIAALRKAIAIGGGAVPLNTGEPREETQIDLF